MFYPAINEQTLVTFNVVTMSMARDPGFLDSPDCPYSTVIKDYFRKTTIALGGGIVEDLFKGKDEIEVLDKQIQAVMSDLDAFAKTLGDADHSEKLAYYKTKSVLIEKLIGMKERILNLKEISEFRNVILTFMDEVCTKDQVSDLMTRLDGVLASDI